MSGLADMVEILAAADVRDVQSGLDALVAAGYWSEDEDDMRRAVDGFLSGALRPEED